MTPVPPEQLPWVAEYGGWIGIGVSIIVVALAVLVVHLAVVIHLRWRAWRQWRRLGEPVAPADIKDGDIIVLEGVLRVRDRGCQRLDDGGMVAASTFETSTRVFWSSAMPTLRQRLKPEIPNPIPLKRASVRAYDMYLDIDGVEVHVEGPIVVAVGSTERTFAYDSLSAAARTRLVEAEGDSPIEDELAPHLVSRSVEDGDRVRIFGETFDHGDTDEDGVSDWTLQEPEEGYLEVVCSGVPTIRRRSQRWVLDAALRGVVAAVVLLFVVGEVASLMGAQHVASLSPFRRSSALRHIHHDGLAALDIAHRRVRDKAVPSRVWLEQMLTVYRLRHDCAAESRLLARTGQYRAAARRSTACIVWCKAHKDATTAQIRAWSEYSWGDYLDRACRDEQTLRMRAVGSWLMAGDFGQASDALENAKAERCAERLYAARVHMWAGRFKRAAVAMSAYSECAGDRKWLSERYGLIAAGQARCMAEAFRYRAGDTAALAKIADDKAHDECTLIKADVLAGAERIKLLEGFRPKLAEHRLVVDMLTLEAGLAQLITSAGGKARALQPKDALAMLRVGVVLPDFGGLGLAALGKLTAIRRPPPRARMLRSNLALRAAGFELAAGDADRAAHWIDVVVRDSPPREPPDGSYHPSDSVEVIAMYALRALLRVSVELRAGRIEAATQWLDRDTKRIAAWSAAGFREHPSVRVHLDEVIQTRKILAALIAYSKTGATKALNGWLGNGLDQEEWGKPKMWEMVAQARGDLILARFDRGLYAGFKVAEPLAVLLTAARMKTGRAALAQALRNGKFAYWSGRGAPKPFGRMAQAALIAELARQLGDAELAARQGELVKRYRDAFLSRPLAMPMFLQTEDR